MLNKDIEAVVKHLRATFNTGKTRSLSWRIAQLKALGAMLKDHNVEFINALKSDTGRPLYEAWSGDVYCAQIQIDATLKGLKKWAKPQSLKTDIGFFPSKAWIMPDPLGVALVIAPWNYPLELVTNPAVGAIAAGNCVVMKPSEIAPHTSALLSKYVPQYLDTDAVAVIEGGVPETTALLAQKFDYIFYTGNGRVGRVILEAAARNLTPVTLELGGKCPCFVTKNANLKVSCNRLAWGKFMNCGQTCTAPDYVLVEKSVEDAFLQCMQKTIKAFYGDNPQKSEDYGRVVNEHHFKRLMALLKGQEVFIGGQADQGDLYIAPTILKNVSPDSPIMQEEIFGPILPVISVPDLEAAIDFVNARPKPLAQCIFTDSRREQNIILERTTTGGVNINTASLHGASPHIPFGGVGESGMGTYHGRWSFETFSHGKSVLHQGTWTELLSQMIQPPYTKRKWTIAKIVTGTW
ncbi:MAG: aldehyde dehydrogenase family protein [Dehalococcoidia bacterium]|nr:MAG: aldehyde dehydrogenase family protein [Dehalococcoidia bacterium]